MLSTICLFYFVCKELLTGVNNDDDDDGMSYETDYVTVSTHALVKNCMQCIVWDSV